MMGAEFVQLSLVPILIGVLAGIACALPGNFLLLRRQALIGDAISHVVLPGIVAGFLVTGGVGGWTAFLGAALAALVAVGLIEVIRRAARVEPGAAMAVVFTAMFAGGVLMLEVSGAGAVHLDVEHALMGSLESLIWLDATGWESLADPAALATLPPELARMALVAGLIGAAVWLFRRPLTLISFDEGHARALGYPVRALSLGLVGAASVAAVAAFDAVGSILVIAMFVGPPATARLLTNALGRQIALSLLIASLTGVLGYVLAGYGPLWLGGQDSVSAGGMIAVLSGLFLGLAALVGPARHPAGRG
jgi:manganese/zinc/iron transport system permease protein